MGAAQHDTGISGSWAGGADGMQVTDVLLRQVDVGVPVRCPMIPSHSGRVSIGAAVTPRTVLPGRSETK